ncbi:SRPBCC family protein [Segnochrobactraceae bacterium EtOH-i3]
MEMTGEVLIPASRARVFAALTDPEILKAALPGCERLEKTSDTDMTADVVAKVGPVKAKFTGAVTLSNIDAPNGYTISGEGKGGVAGFAKGGADVALSDAQGGTKLSYKVNAQVGGKLAQVGARLIDSTAKKMADEFFATFSTLVAAEEAPTDQPVPAGRLDDTDPVTGVPYNEAAAENEVVHEAEAALEAAEEKLEAAAGAGILGGPVVWGLIGIIILVILIGAYH